MASELLPAAVTPSTTTIATTAANTTTTTTAAAANDTTPSPTSTSPATTVFSISEDDLREIFLRLPDLPSLVRAALTCRPWLQAVRSSRPFRRLFRALHPAPLIGLFLKIGNASVPSFLPLRCSDPVVSTALRRGDFFLTSLPPSPKGWSLADCRDGYVLLWNGSQERPSVAALNPMTWAVDVLPPLPGEIAAGSRREVAVLGFHLLSSDESPWSFRVTSVCTARRRVRAAVFSSETWEWAIGPWVRVGGYCSLKFMTGTLVGGSVFWPYDGEARMIRSTPPPWMSPSWICPREWRKSGTTSASGRLGMVNSAMSMHLISSFMFGFVVVVWMGPRFGRSRLYSLWVQNSISSLAPPFWTCSSVSKLCK